MKRVIVSIGMTAILMLTVGAVFRVEYETRRTLVGTAPVRYPVAEWLQDRDAPEILPPRLTALWYVFRAEEELLAGLG